MAKKLNFTAIIDKREQKPLTLRYTDRGDILPSEPGTLYTGDYSLKGFESYVAIERKSLSDMMGCIGTNRERFEKEVVRLRGYEVSCLVIESNWKTIEAGNYRSRIDPSAAIGTLMGWIAQGLPVVMADNHKRAGIFVARMLYITARKRHAELKALGG